MDLPPDMLIEWADQHTLSRASVGWLAAHPDGGDGDPISSGIAALRAQAQPPPHG